jgi:hypothetical protein
MTFTQGVLIMAKFKTWLIFAGIISFFALVIFIMNLPIFSSKNIQMDKYSAADLAKTDFEKGYVRFIEIYREPPKVKGAETPPSGKWVILPEREMVKTVLDKYSKKVRIEPDYSKEEKAFKKEESDFSVNYNRAMLKLVLANDKTLPAMPPQAVKPPPPPQPVIIDSGDIPMEKVKANVLSKTDFDRGKIRFIETFKEDPKYPDAGKWVVPLEKDIGKDILEQYPDRIRIEKKADVDPKVFQKNEAGYASSYNKSMLKFINPEAAIFKTPAKQPAETAKPSQEKKSEEPIPAVQPVTTDKPEESKKPELPVEQTDK